MYGNLPVIARWRQCPADTNNRLAIAAQPRVSGGHNAETMRMTYAPKPIDTRHIKLTAEQQQLIENLALNVHDVWGQKRLEDGWVYGPNRDDGKKMHPGLVPYAELSEGEKDYDRVMVEQVVRAAIALGYRIEKA
jgi:hypothetical protein